MFHVINTIEASFRQSHVTQSQKDRLTQMLQAKYSRQSGDLDPELI